MSQQDSKKSLGLNVLRTNDKVDALRREMTADGAGRVGAASAAVPSADHADRTAAEAAPTPPAPTMDEDQRTVHDRVVETLQTIYDPELPVNVYDLGLIYGIDVDAELAVRVRMTLTAPACPVADSIVREVELKVRDTPGVSAAKVELVWSPPWDKSRMTEAALLELGLL